ncbi:hypothetical protein MATR_22710 [Marivirga tractuosa]|uniref:Uncharacterized protein n=1 Tax=Marivirga tractuosa (strain ATCC 23168 / DSM 4126 / NBRC 15989 / NCIMB 1408 / VKM B-1430 / H-43) TaxID=643867 RepID=E4TVI4_MARTH|nr:DUF6629 family protein [Marivirga tractuosa]ADR20116.1 hypothetical protein Ftrac_0103 [Marivirga tractuosa DSM 4126]BDD15446.1 hypothetical protein MATR_22710 [Marivirga tractuosa]
MCFSAGASFTAGAILTSVGTVSLMKTKKSSEIPFASIPLFFGLQQIAEGFVWLSLTNPDFTFIESISAHAFIFFAQVLWPVWVPLSIYKFEKNMGLKATVGKLLIGMGMLVAVVLGYFLFTVEVQAEILGDHISYSQSYIQQFGIIGGVFYLGSTAIPPFITSNKKMWVLGASILLAYVLTEIFYAQYVVSVWCFFAAILSAMVLWIILSKKRN